MKIILKQLCADLYEVLQKLDTIYGEDMRSIIVMTSMMSENYDIIQQVYKTFKQLDKEDFLEFWENYPETEYEKIVLSEIYEYHFLSYFYGDIEYTRKELVIFRHRINN